MKLDFPKISNPAPVISLFPYKTNYYKLCIIDALAKCTIESSVIWLSERLSCLIFLRQGRLTII